MIFHGNANFYRQNNNIIFKGVVWYARKRNQTKISVQNLSLCMGNIMEIYEYEIIRECNLQLFFCDLAFEDLKIPFCGFGFFFLVAWNSEYYYASTFCCLCYDFCSLFFLTIKCTLLHKIDLQSIVDLN